MIFYLVEVKQGLPGINIEMVSPTALYVRSQDCKSLNDFVFANALAKKLRQVAS